MKLAAFDDTHVGIVEDDVIFDVTSILPALPDRPPIFMDVLIDQWPNLQTALFAAKREAAALPLDEVRLMAPSPAPMHLVAAPANYHKHVNELGSLGSGGRTMRDLGFFLKAPSSLLAAGGTILLPRGSSRNFHHECELAVVIGKRTKNISPADALSSVFGYSCLMDITMRVTEDLREERVLRKSFDTFTPFGPWIVTADEIPDPQRLKLSLHVNGELRQDATSAEMVLSVAEQISYISSVMTLEPGDVLATGTPGGVGPIHPGDTIRIDIERIGGFQVSVAEAPEVAPKEF